MGTKNEWVERDADAVDEDLARPPGEDDAVAVAEKQLKAMLTGRPANGPPEQSASAASLAKASAEGTVDAPVTWVFEPESFAPLAKIVGGERFGIVTDHLGTPRAMFDGAGAEVWGADIDAYGDLRNLRGKRQACPFRWPGQYEDEETGLYYNRFRYYSARSGSYLSQDPIRLASDQANLYAYTDDVNLWIDPNGLSFGSGKGPHRAIVNVFDDSIVNVFDDSGERISRDVLQSGNMTPAERALGFPQSTLATHTEARATKNIPLSTGQRMQIIGQYPPCSSCKGRMNAAARESGAAIEYIWRDAETGKVKKWTTGGCKK